MYRLSDRVTNLLCRSGIISQNDKEIYQFGMDAAFLKFIHTFTMVIVGAMFNMLAESIIFILFFSVLRVFAGGIHAKTKIACYVISWIMILSVLATIKFLPLAILKLLCFALFLLSIIIIWWLAPQGSDNKPLEPQETAVYRKRALINLAIESALISMLYCLQAYSWAAAATFGLMMVAVMLALRKLQVIVRRCHHSETIL